MAEFTPVIFTSSPQNGNNGWCCSRNVGYRPRQLRALLTWILSCIAARHTEVAPAETVVSKIGHRIHGQGPKSGVNLITYCGVFVNKDAHDLDHIQTISIYLGFNPFQPTGYSTYHQVSHLTKRAMYVWRNNEARSCNHCCSESITYSECAFVAMLTQHAMRMRHVVICGLSGYIISFHIISQTTCFSGGGGSGGISEHTCSDFLYKFSLNISRSKKNSWRYYHKCVSVFVWSTRSIVRF